MDIHNHPTTPRRASDIKIVGREMATQKCCHSHHASESQAPIKKMMPKMTLTAATKLEMAE
jgi:hypothetical protein